jgi:hypothetical protein
VRPEHRVDFVAIGFRGGSLASTAVPILGTAVAFSVDRIGKMGDEFRAMEPSVPQNGTM